MPSLPRAIAEERLAQARVGRLATVTAHGEPHVVAVCFALHDGRIVNAVDAKPKRTRHLKRLDNIRATGHASLLVDHYEDDWTQLWWVRLRGRARVLDDGEEAERALAALIAKYGQYREVAPGLPVLAVDVADWHGWAAKL